MTKPRKKRLADRDRRRVETIKRKKGANWFHENAKKAGKLTPTKYDSDTGRAAANARWEKHRAERKEQASGSSDSES